MQSKIKLFPDCNHAEIKENVISRMKERTHLDRFAQPFPRSATTSLRRRRNLTPVSNQRFGFVCDAGYAASVSPYLGSFCSRSLFAVEEPASTRFVTRKSCGNTRLRLVFPQHFSFFPQTFTSVSITRYKHRTCFLFLLENNATRKRKTTC